MNAQCFLNKPSYDIKSVVVSFRPKEIVLSFKERVKRVAEVFFNCAYHTRQDIEIFGKYITSLPNNLGENPYPLFHNFADGVYTREIHLPAGHVVVGKLHKLEGLVYVLKGKLLVADEFETKMVTAPVKISSKAGVKRVVYILEDTVWMDIHHTNKTTVPEAEKELFVSEYEEMMQDLGLPEDKAKSISENENDRITVKNDSIEIMDSKIQGKGVFAIENIACNQLIGLARISDKRTDLGRYANHSFRPNAALSIEDNALLFTAKDKIIIGDEITVDYREARKFAQELDVMINNSNGRSPCQECTRL